MNIVCLCQNKSGASASVFLCKKNAIKQRVNKLNSVGKKKKKHSFLKVLLSVKTILPTFISHPSEGKILMLCILFAHDIASCLVSGLLVQKSLI